ncbi:MAG: glycoside hydrolase family 3 C-terminal domain-containing protein [Lachnospiraceae bacterium]|nr:glycoside hydrolase family 3 C-terminal domain-containing protein [Lachnospiraceae bacterium]
MKLNDYEKKHLQAFRTVAAECTVLLKENGDFPLDTCGKIALYGSGARHTVKGGTGSGEVNSRFFVTAEQGLEDAGFTITTKAWLDGYDRMLTKARQNFKKEIKALARKNHTLAVNIGMGAVMPEPEYELPLEGDADAAVYVLSRISGEGNDRKPVSGDVLLSRTEQRDILALQKKYKKFLLVLNVGGPVDLTPVLCVENILILSQLGVETGAVLADIILGRAYPSGKLTTTWSAWQDYPTVGEFGCFDDTRYQDGIYVGYRYFDSVGKIALFPFGYGASYTSFFIQCRDVRVDGENIAVTAKVQNTGKCSGREVVQLYVSVPEGKLDQPYQVLAGWQKTKELKAGEQEELTICFKLSDLESYDTAAEAYILEQGDYILRLGNSSVNTDICSVIRLEETVTTLRAKRCLGKTDFVDWKPAVRPVAAVPNEIPVHSVKASDIACRKLLEEVSKEIDPEVETFTDQQLAWMNVGGFDPKAGILSIVGNASTRVAGAAGETTGELKDKNVPMLIMADGPAGLRLSQKYMKEGERAIALGESMPRSVAEYLPKIALWLLKVLRKKPKKDTVIHEQYTTAIPIGTALAQSWNPDAAQICGDIVGDEMERFGVHLWLAPALNIHRNILCGRNFEYFSEDPLISGTFAAALTKGVQKHSGCGTTIKHFAANNQETNRYSNNSMVSERAMREIYLRGFYICIKQSQPHALMTSYNLLNGVHTSEHKGLSEDILRREFGFKGIVMTDWIIPQAVSKKSVYPMPQPAKMAAVGSDLMMPGTRDDVENILKGLTDGTVSRKQLQMNATRVFRMAKKLVGRSDMTSK